MMESWFLTYDVCRIRKNLKPNSPNFICV